MEREAGKGWCLWEAYVLASEKKTIGGRAEKKKDRARGRKNRVKSWEATGDGVRWIPYKSTEK